MNNLEKLTAVGELVYGKDWKSPLARELQIDVRTVRRFVSGASNIPVNLSSRLLAAMGQELDKIKAAIDLINSDKVHGEDVTIEMIAGIADRYEYAGEEYGDVQHRKAAIDEMNNAIYDVTYLSDLEAIAQKWARRDA